MNAAASAQKHYISGFHIGCADNWSDEDLAFLVRLLKQPILGHGGVLGGRSAVGMLSVPHHGDLVVKYYTRGGLMRRFIKRHYFKWGPTRPELEFEIMSRVGEVGVRTPKPIAWAWQGRPFYRGCLITQEVPGHRTLADLALRDEEAAIELLPALDEQIRILIDNRILHVDLHPGNVLVDHENRIYIVDFDRARDVSGSAEWLRDQYVLRWRRAVIKHQLPEVLNEVMCAKLRTNPHYMPV